MKFLLELIFGPRSVANITRGLGRMVADLEAHEKEMDARAHALAAKLEATMAEQAAAKNVHAKIAALVSVDTSASA